MALSTSIVCILALLVAANLALRGVQSARTIRHKWRIDYQFRSPDCVERAVIAINGQSPGPTIRARAGDTLIVELQNLMPTEAVVLHWHGIRQIGTPWFDGTPSVCQCPILAGETFIYKFVLDKAGTYFYHGHYGLQRSEGLYGSLIVDPPAGEKEPFHYNEELNIVLNDWWHKPAYQQGVGLFSKPFRWVGEPQSLLINGRGRYDCATPFPPETSKCNGSNPDCLPHVLPVESGKIYRLRIASVASLSSLNLIIEGHKMTVVEADGNYVEPVEVANLDVYSGETYSVLVTASQDATQNYWIAVNVRGRPPQTAAGLAILNYVNNKAAQSPSRKPPISPPWDDYAYSLAQAQAYVARIGYELEVPVKADRRIVLLNTQNLVDGVIKWALNNISLAPTATPYLPAMKYGIQGAYSTVPPPDAYARNHNTYAPPVNPVATAGSGVYVFPFNSTVDVVLQNANTLTPNKSEIHPWHMHGHDFWVLGYGFGTFDPLKQEKTYNLRNPPLRNTVPVFPYGWTAIRFRTDNPGVWPFHCHVESHFHMGMGVIFAEGIEKVGPIPHSTMGCGLTKNYLQPPKP